MPADKILEELTDKVGIIKIDVEGGELEVIEGLCDTIKTHRPIISCEVLPAKSYDNSEIERNRIARQKKLEDLITSFGYSIWNILAKNNCLLKINKIPILNDLDRTNYIFVPSSKNKSFERTTSKLKI